jgi:hypothetical protein
MATKTPLPPKPKQKSATDPLWPFAGRPLSQQDAELMELIGDILDSVEKTWEPRKRDWALPYLKHIYRGFRRWKSQGCARSIGRRLRRLYGLRSRRGTHLSRTLIDVTLPAADRRRKSRWVRVVEAADAEQVRPCSFAKFVRGNGGIAGTAQRITKRRVKGAKKNDWVE